MGDFPRRIQRVNPCDLQKGSVSCSARFDFPDHLTTSMTASPSAAGSLVRDWLFLVVKTSAKIYARDLGSWYLLIRVYGQKSKGIFENWSQQSVQTPQNVSKNLPSRDFACEPGSNCDPLLSLKTFELGSYHHHVALFPENYPQVIKHGNGKYGCFYPSYEPPF